MRIWLSAGGVFFVYIAVVACVLPRLPRRKRVLVVAVAAASLLVTVLIAGVTLPPILAGWILPPLFLLTAYWTSGLLFVAPMPRAERALLRIDRLLGVSRIAAAAPRPLAEFLEFAYAAVYLAIPVALAIHLLAAEQPDADRFWTVILMTDYVCFGMLPWVQTRPPRTLDTTPPWTARFRAINLRLLGMASIHANTFPSGHAAEALATALLVIGAPWPWVAWMFFNAAAISAGTVLGRYHYGADVIAGWAVALVVWMALG